MQDLQTAPKTALVGTCSWVWELGFQGWLLEPNGAYWVQGTPGSGKTTLMGYLASNSGMRLQQRRENMLAPAPPVVVASYYFQADHTHMARSLEGLLRSLIWQIANQLPSATELLTVHYRRLMRTTSSFSWSLADLEGAFRDIVSSSSSAQVCVFIDGLDEHGGEDEVIASFLDELIHSLPRRVRFCLSSRPYPDFAFQFRTLLGFKMHEHINGDIKTYVDHRFIEAHHLQFNSLSQLSEKTIDKAKRSFLWVKLACDELQRSWRHGRSLADLERCLEEMPKDLGPFYARILDSLDDREAQELARMLNVVVDAGKHLTVTEFCHALDFGRPVHEHTTPDFLPFDLEGKLDELSGARSGADHGQVMPWKLDQPTRDEYSSLEVSGHVSERIELCSRGLIMVRPNDVRLSHETILHFWVQHRQAQGRGSEGSEMLLGACVSYIALLSRHLTIGTARATPLIALDMNYPFINYAVMWVTHHGESAERSSSTAQLPIMERFIGPPLVFWQTVIREKRLQTFHPALNLVEFCIEFSMHRTAFAALSSRELAVGAIHPKSLAQRGHERVPGLATPIYNINMNGGRLLFQAAMHDRTLLLDDLLNRGATLDPDLPLASMALHRAIYQENMQFVRRFLDLCSSVSPLPRLSVISSPRCARCRRQLGKPFFRYMLSKSTDHFLCNHCTPEPEHSGNSFTECVKVPIDGTDNDYEVFELPRQKNKRGMILGHFTLLCEPELFVWDRYWRRELLHNNIVLSPLEFAVALDRQDAADELLRHYPKHARLLGYIYDALITAAYYGRLVAIKSLLVRRSGMGLVEQEHIARHSSRQCMIERGQRHSCHPIIAAVHGGFVDALRELLCDSRDTWDVSANCKSRWVGLLSCDICSSPLHVAIANFRSLDVVDSRAIIEMLSNRGCTLSSSVRAVLPELVEMQSLTSEDLQWVLRKVPWSNDESNTKLVRPLAPEDDAQHPFDREKDEWEEITHPVFSSRIRRTFVPPIRSPARLG